MVEVTAVILVWSGVLELYFEVYFKMVNRLL
jgi:hypothetical protein